ncbi:isoaspartyl peptidase/L-asparaginase-like [Dendronephthya gigantea]|uniref:isoaspartyl peptidase/L-asparaginase-like n=1 Tax=Dendronephthya gigantea TaxID=151771 RepID=UPI00106AAA48|nr:isoaspartyl peptidase/L-asparaginase-like [Dendronephthya gigantea]XP_028408579.1 isoaspartyl peptidase/L-asparaginase-like [Dendronephthya gigantea]XP_028408580.1 isoaspartyl peptidase/L-asparaginase-like [Dendronephthya gigantea]
MAENITSGMSELSISSADAGQRGPRIIVQGGAFNPYQEPSGRKEDFMTGVKESAKAGYAILTNGGTAVDAVEAAVRELEDNGNFNAGYGSYLNNNGEVECDALIMDGNTLDTGAVMNGRYFRNPVSLAKKIMQDSYHCALSGDGALEFALRHGVRLYDPSKLISERAREKTYKYENFPKTVRTIYPGGPFEEEHDTVSAVAMDAKGNLACAMSSGGIPGKLKGRVGDAALVGCGGYANKHGAATVSGHGESIMKMTLAREVVSMMEEDEGKESKDAQESAEIASKKLLKRIGFCGACGIIAIDKNGKFGREFKTKAMPWASIVGKQMEYGMDPYERKTEFL